MSVLGSPWALTPGRTGRWGEWDLQRGWGWRRGGSRYAAVEPEAHGVEAGLFDFRIAPIEVWLLDVEEVVVVLVDGGDPLPGSAAEGGDQLLGGTTFLPLRSSWAYLSWKA